MPESPVQGRSWKPKVAALTSFGAAPSLTADLPSTSKTGAPISWFELLAEDWPETRAILASRVEKAATRNMIEDVDRDPARIGLAPAHVR